MLTAEQLMKGVSVDNPTYDEAIYMVKIKRQRAKEAINRILERYSVISCEPAPGMEVLLDYFTNMVYGLELLLKVLARDWDNPGETSYGHNVGKMYEAIFGRQHTDPAFIKELKDAILDQKFIYEPANGLVNRIEAMETLWDELKVEYMRGAWGRISTVHQEVQTDAAFGQYLLCNVARFTKGPTHVSDPMTTEQKIAMKRCQIEHLQREITRLETEGERELAHDKLFDMLHERFNSEVERRKQMMQMIFQMGGTSALRFSVMTMGMAAQDLG
jgi:hypothetical protein